MSVVDSGWHAAAFSVPKEKGGNRMDKSSLTELPEIELLDDRMDCGRTGVA